MDEFGGKRKKMREKEKKKERGEEEDRASRESPEVER